MRPNTLISIRRTLVGTLSAASLTAANLSLAFGLAAMAIVHAETPPKMKMTTDIPAEITTPDEVETRLGTLKFNDGFPDEAAVQKVYDNLDFQRGVSVFLDAMPGGSTEAARKGFASMGADNNQTVLIMEELMDSKSLFLTPNTESIYNMMWLDLKDGPLVFETPPDVLGVIDDHWFQYVADFGRVGQDRGKGGKYLLLPPGYEGEVPDGYFVLRPKTYGILIFWRGFMVDGDTKPAVEASKKFTKVYNLSDAAAVGNATARALVFKYRGEGNYLYADSAWFTCFIGGSYEFLSQPGVRNPDARVHFIYYATGITPAMALKLVGNGSQYAAAATDSEGRPLDGSRTYKIHLPPNIPAKDFWSFVVYDNQTRSMLQTDQRLPSIGSNDKEIVINPDTSVDVWFGPTAPEGHESNWVQTAPGKGWNVLLRLYGPGEAWLDKTWQPGEFELVK